MSKNVISFLRRIGGTKLIKFNCKSRSLPLAFLWTLKFLDSTGIATHLSLVLMACVIKFVDLKSSSICQREVNCCAD